MSSAASTRRWPPRRTWRFITERIRELLGERQFPTGQPPIPDLAEHARAILDARLFEPVTMAALAAELGTGPTHVARAFSEAFGIPPHRYVLGRRLDVARDRILAGRPLADVAAEVGFSDQAHFTRRFRRFLGTTPGRFAEGARSLPRRADEPVSAPPGSGGRRRSS